MPIALDIRLDIAIGRTRTYDTRAVPAGLRMPLVRSAPSLSKISNLKIHVMKFYSSHQLPVPAEDGIYHQSFILH